MNPPVCEDVIPMLSVKRVYEAPSPADGARVLVDRLWPRGLTKEAADVKLWLRDLAPSDALRIWYHAHPEAWAQFRKHYFKELKHPEAVPALEQLYTLKSKKKRVTLLFASRNIERNNAVALKELMDGAKKPPTGTGPAAALAVRKRAVVPKGTRKG
jgi:uncharacterized protein YeaO (DUF488 family)